MPELSVIIPSRNERWLKNTVEDILAHMEADTEVIVIADGAWPDPRLDQHERVHIIHHPTSVGQRAATNEGARVSTATFVMKADAHCAFDQGFDRKIMEPYKTGELGREVTSVPTMYNLHVFDWVCTKCQHRHYQGPTPTECPKCKAPKAMERELIWKPRLSRRSDYMRFDHELHFQYWGAFGHRPEAKADIVDQMCCVGACWMMRRDRYWEIEGMDEGHGSWGQMGVELACKSWLSGGRQVVNKRTWFSHLFRTQGGDFGFPYPNPGVDKARNYSRRMWLGNLWKKQTRPFAWLIEHFAPVPDWPDGAPAETAVMAEKPNTVAVVAPSDDFETPLIVAAPERLETPQAAPVRPAPAPQPPPVQSDEDDEPEEPLNLDEEPAPAPVPAIILDRPPSGIVITPPRRLPTKGLVYYSDGRPAPELLALVQRQIRTAAKGLPVVSVTLTEMDFGDERYVLPLQRGILTMFRQICHGLESLKTDVVFLVEHDVLYHRDHFDFEPPTDRAYYYNEHAYRLDWELGQALFYFTKQTSGLCANREFLLDHYRRRIAKVIANAEELTRQGLPVRRDGFSQHMGFEPGCHMPPRGVDDYIAVRWLADRPNIDIRHDRNLTPNRWSPDEFRNSNARLGWTMTDEIPGWGRTKGRMPDFIAEVRRAQNVQ